MLSDDRGNQVCWSDIREGIVSIDPSGTGDDVAQLTNIGGIALGDVDGSSGWQLKINGRQGRRY